eukprot:970273-Rhodomonas_salina.1
MERKRRWRVKEAWRERALGSSVRGVDEELGDGGWERSSVEGRWWETAATKSQEMEMSAGRGA